MSMTTTDNDELHRYRTQGGIDVQRSTTIIADMAEAARQVEHLVDRLDVARGVLLSSSYEYPGRYTRWDIGFGDPALVVSTKQRTFSVEAANGRGAVLLPAIELALRSQTHVDELCAGDHRLDGSVRITTGRFPEEQRSRQPSVFSVVRTLINLFASDEDPHLGLYGAFGYDLAYQFEAIDLHIERPADQRDLILYLPDELLVIDHRAERAEIRRYDFAVADHSTIGLERSGVQRAYVPDELVTESTSDHPAGEYAALVDEAKKSFACGDLFEVVPGQRFVEPNRLAPSELFRRLRERNPAPYGFLISLGDAEWLVGASPEMYVRVDGDRVETCPISGTIARGGDPISDAAQILALLNSEKDESELTMCTDVDRNDKSRICVAGSVKVLGRRQIELYSRLIHTVDHVEGRLRPEFDALDAFLSHTWAVTVTGAPKLWAMRWLEAHERTPRAWYGGAIGMVGFDGNMNTGLTLRTIRLKDGAAQVRVGATLLFDSDPVSEEQETELKASAFLDAIRSPVPAGQMGSPLEKIGAFSAVVSPVQRRVLLVDHEDSFVHTLASYVRAAGGDVITLRAGFTDDELDAVGAELVVLSPGPGRPGDFGLAHTIELALARRLPIFGVCLGLQGIVEYFGGTLGVLALPVHGKPSPIHVIDPGVMFTKLPDVFEAGRYHSLFALADKLPSALKVTALTGDGVVMGIEHTTLAVAAVQFHPESIMTLGGEVGLRLVRNVVENLR